MRNFVGCLLLAVFAISLASFAQSGAAQSGTAKSQNAAPTRSLAGTKTLSAPRGVPWMIQLRAYGQRALPYDSLGGGKI